MNKVCRLFCSRIKEISITASELVYNRVCSMGCVAGVLCAVTVIAVGNVHALPSGGQVAAGQAAISQDNPNRMQINQTSSQAVINWNSFSIAANESVNINQPSSHASLL